MTSTLQKLLETGLVCDSDEISFQFKGHTFGARLMPGGLISHCTWNSEAVLQDKVAFTTLTDWCDTCIQELVDEYVTRFSSWKRVRHVPTGSSFAQLRARLSDKARTTTGCECAEVQRYRRQVLELQMKVQELDRLVRCKRKAPEKIADDNPFRLKF